MLPFNAADFLQHGRALMSHDIICVFLNIPDSGIAFAAEHGLFR